MTIEYKLGDKDTRPWGTWEVIGVGKNYIVKQIFVLCGKKLSLQSHHFRDEYWIIVDGMATVTLGNDIIQKSSNSVIFIPKEMKHRIANETDSSIAFIEVQTGDTLDESDIIRYEDAYGRV